MQKHIVILGSGGFGTSLAVTLFRCGYHITLWSAFPKELEELRQYGENRKLLPGVAVDSAIEFDTDIHCASKADLVIIAVPSFAVRNVAAQLGKVITPQTVIANVGKGFEESSLLRLSEVIEAECPNNPVVVVSGPSHAEEIARGVPTTLVAASKNRASAEYVQDMLMTTNLRVYVNDDITGVELGGALKNIIALCAGVLDGMGLGDNVKAALMTRGLAEIARLGVAMGAHSSTFAGLTGMGDLIVTCTSMHSRNRRAGILIGQGLSAKDAIERVGMTVEGVSAARAAYHLAQKYGVEMPIVEQLHEVLENNKSVHDAVVDLMERPKRHENEKIWLAAQSQQ